jgi:2-oxo-4-hydroxy-4-carboxy--5-ureidoimidazoline (OHCU) decarboxylase
MTSTDQELWLARAQRDQAIACAILSFFIALAMVFSVFAPETEALQTRKEIVAHYDALAQLQEVLKRNTAELAQDQESIGLLRRAAHP